MNLTVEIPDDIAGQLSANGVDLARGVLEGFALEQYKSRQISKAQLRRLLGFETRYELDGFLKAHDVWTTYTIEDLQREVATLEQWASDRATRCSRHEPD